MSRQFEVFPCSVERFVYDIEMLDLDERLKIERHALGGLLCMQRVDMSTTLLECLLQSYDPSEDKFVFGSGESFGIYHDDVDVIMGLENKGVSAQLDGPTGDIPDLFKEQCTGDGFPIGSISKLMWKKGISEDDFIRCFVLLSLGTILAPVSWKFIPTNYFSLVQDVAKIKEINWNELTLGFLKTNLAVNAHSNKWPSGNLPLLQYCYWEKIRPSFSNFFYFGRTPPLMKYWNKETAARRELYDISFGRSNGIVLDDLSQAPTIYMLQNDANKNNLNTPNSMTATSCNGCKDIKNKVLSLENSMKRCLHVLYSSDCDDENGTKKDSPQSVATTLEGTTRTRKTPNKYMPTPPLDKSAKRGKRG